VLSQRSRMVTRRVSRVAFPIACALIALAVAAGIAKLILDAPSHATSDRLSVALAVSGILGGLAAVVSAGLAFRQGRSPRQDRAHVLPPHLMADDPLVDRTTEMRALVERIDSSRVVNCHGQRGAGKSFLLEHLADVVNGHRTPTQSHPVPQHVSVALYFDLADAVGFEEIGSQVFRESVGNSDADWTDFITDVEKKFSKRRVLLILDNVNTPGLWPALGTAAYEYLASRPDDKVVFGSIEPVVLDNLRVQHLPALGGLDREAIKQLAATRGDRLDGALLAELHEQFEGLPMYVRLLTAYEGEFSAGQRTAVMDSVIDVQLIPDLAPDARRLLAFVSLLGVVTRQVSVTDLEHCPVADLDAQVELAIRQSLLSPIPHPTRRVVKVHDVVRDAALRVLAPEVTEGAHFLFERARNQERYVDAAFYSMFSDPKQIGAKAFDEVFEPVVRVAVDSRDYALLSNLHLRASQSARVMRFLASDQDRFDLYCYARASQLAGLGQYREAEDELLASSIVSARPGQYDSRSDLQLEMLFLQADVAHLLNRYDEAGQMFEQLCEWAAAARRTALQARCTWAHAHVLRHQGRDLERALRLFADAAKLASASGELFARAHSITGASGIRVFLGALDDDEEAQLGAVEEEIAASVSHDRYMLRVWKAQARVAWSRGDADSAFAIVEAAIDKALALNDRALYNLYFERAEFLRLSSRPAESLGDYKRALLFGEGNGDRNLIANSLLGVVLAERAAGAWLHHGSKLEALASTLHARQIASEADVQVTSQIAAQVATALEGDDPSKPVRLIVF
jgi:tetratricopeptide (TPR) repeat protein